MPKPQMDAVENSLVQISQIPAKAGHSPGVLYLTFLLEHKCK